MLERAAYLVFVMALLTLGVWPQGVSIAHEGATGVVKERMEAMKTMEERMKAMAAMLKGERQWNLPYVETSARQIAKHANDLPRLFPTGSDGHPSEALPSIWQEKQRFEQLAQELSGKAMKLAALSKTKKQVELIPPFSAVAKTCKACHGDFRKKK